MDKPSLGARLRYAFDRSLSRGPVALVSWLAALSVLIIVAFSLLVWGAGIAPQHEDGSARGLAEIAWMSLMRTLDAGTMGGDTGSWAFLFGMFGVTLGGVFVISAFIGILTSGLEARIEELRKGRSRVIESDHTVVLGWSPQVFNIVSELVEANASRKRAAVVILGEADKVEMEDAIRERVPDTRTTRVVCRSGSPTDMGHLDRVSVQTARSIIVTAPQGKGADASVIKTLLALTHSPTRRKEPYHIVAELRDERNLEAARLASRGEAKLVLAADLISRITVQTCRQPGLSVVITELLDFDGDEIYFHDEPALVGRTFGEALAAYRTSAVIGLFQRGRVLLNPPMDTPIAAGDRIIAVSEDDDTLVLAGAPAPAPEEAHIRLPARPAPAPESALVLGWSARLPFMIRELDRYVPPGSHVAVAAPGEIEAELRAAVGTLQRQSLTVLRADPTSRAALEALDVGAYAHVILLSEDGLEPEEADARTLVTLLHLRDMAEKSGRRVPVVSEMLDVRNRELAEMTRADDFVVSEKLVGLLMSQISENAQLDAVFRDLFDPEGSEVYLKPAEEYVELGAPVTFYTVLEAARRRGEVALGYRIAGQADDPEAHGVVVNPDKAERVTYAPGDRIVVLAQD
jgi:voltage-gated potassium channel Kch/K+/H+ antiporter YhaU regulatory subunit KhtT